MTSIDFDQIKNSHAISDVVGRYVAWDKSKSTNDDYWACCPFHSEKSPSFHVTDSKQAFKCFGCGVSGDVFDFLKMVEGKSAPEVAAMIDSGYQPSKIAPKKIAKPAETYVIQKPRDERIVAGERLKVWNPKRAQWNYCKPTAAYLYCDRDGEAIGYVIRIDAADGKKITPQVMWVTTDDGEFCWAWAPFRKPKPMYRLQDLRDGDVWLCEGEKATDAAREMGLNALGWPGGVDGVSLVDWSPLDGRSVIMWRDNDAAGLKAANDISARQKGSKFTIVGGETARASGWDAADAMAEGWDADKCIEWASGWMVEPVDMPEAPIYDAEPIEYAHAPNVLASAPFRILGYNKDVYYYLPHGKQQVVALKASEHTSLRLYQLASLNYWAITFSNGTMSDSAWAAAANALISTSHQEGIFEDSRQRGRGAWLDKGRIIVHTGGEARVDGQSVALPAIKSTYVYEAMPAWEFGYGDDLNSTEANKLVEICQRLTWVDPLSAALLAGWCVIAPVSGALKWRPHIWITGPSQSGKTTAVEEIVGRLVGPAAERFDGKATEAAIRQLMGYDARPIIFDEAEGEDQASAVRMQQILDLARVSSSGGRIPKGGQNGQAKTYIIRSCFCFASINTAVRHHADESRISKLVLVPNHSEGREEHYQSLMLDIGRWFTPEYASSMFSRTVKHLPTLLANAAVFTSAAAVAFHSRRAADQLGAMLAGYYLCFSDREITYEKAAEFISRHNWNEHLSLDSEKDEMRLFRFIMSRTVRVETGAGAKNMSIGQAIDAVKTEQIADPYAKALGPFGIRYSDGFILIANQSDKLREMFKDHPMWSDWRRSLGMIDGAEKSNKAMYFAPGLVQRMVAVPVGHLDGSYVEREPGEEG